MDPEHIDKVKALLTNLSDTYADLKTKIENSGVELSDIEYSQLDGSKQNLDDCKMEIDNLSNLEFEASVENLSGVSDIFERAEAENFEAAAKVADIGDTITYLDARSTLISEKADNIARNFDQNDVNELKALVDAFKDQTANLERSIQTAEAAGITIPVDMKEVLASAKEMVTEAEATVNEKITAEASASELVDLLNTEEKVVTPEAAASEAAEPVIELSDIDTTFENAQVKAEADAIEKALNSAAELEAAKPEIKEKVHLQGLNEKGHVERDLSAGPATNDSAEPVKPTAAKHHQTVRIPEDVTPPAAAQQTASEHRRASVVTRIADEVTPPVKPATAQQTASEPHQVVTEKHRPIITREAPATPVAQQTSSQQHHSTVTRVRDEVAPPPVKPEVQQPASVDSTKPTVAEAAPAQVKPEQAVVEPTKQEATVANEIDDDEEMLVEITPQEPEAPTQEQAEQANPVQAWLEQAKDKEEQAAAPAKPILEVAEEQQQLFEKGGDKHSKGADDMQVEDLDQEQEHTSHKGPKPY